MSIGYANICSSVQDHRQKFKCLSIKHKVLKNKWEQWDLQKGSLSIKKASEEKRFWRSPEADVIRGSKDHQKLKDWQFQSLLQVVILMPMCAEGVEAWSNDYFRGIWRHWMLIHWRAQKKDNSTIVQPLLHSPCLLLYKDTDAPTLFCFIHGMDSKLFLYRTITKSSNRSLV